jgi:hypothetical protein
MAILLMYGRWDLWNVIILKLADNINRDHINTLILLFNYIGHCFNGIIDNVINEIL